MRRFTETFTSSSVESTSEVVASQHLRISNPEITPDTTPDADLFRLGDVTKSLLCEDELRLLCGEVETRCSYSERRTAVRDARSFRPLSQFELSVLNALWHVVVGGELREKVSRADEFCREVELARENAVAESHRFWWRSANTQVWASTQKTC